MKQLISDFKIFYQKALKEVEDNTFYINNIKRKYIHSIKVLRIGNKIRNNTKILYNNSNNKLETIAIKALLFHDVGRFNEAKIRYQQEKLQKKQIKASSLKINHGNLGVKLLKNNPKYNDIRILFAIKYHGQMIEKAIKSKEYQTAKTLKVKKEMLNILYLVRDADKLENLYRIKNQNNLTKDVFYKQLSKEAKIAPPSPKVLKQLFAKKVVKFSTVYSYADRLIMVLSWFFDINYKESYQIIKENNYKQYLLDELKIYNQDKSLQLKIQKLLKKY